MEKYYKIKKGIQRKEFWKLYDKIPEDVPKELNKEHLTYIEKYYIDIFLGENSCGKEQSIIRKRIADLTVDIQGEEISKERYEESIKKIEELSTLLRIEFSNI